VAPLAHAPRPRRAGAAGAAPAAYFLLGAGLLAPYNAFLTATDYYGALAAPGAHTERLFTLAYLPACALTLASSLRADLLSGAASSAAASTSPSARVQPAFLAFAAIAVAVPLADAVLSPTPGAAGAFLTLSLALVAATGVIDGAAQGAVFGEAAAVSPALAHAVTAGTAASGLVICLLRAATKALLPGQLRASAWLYFGATAALSLACAAVRAVVLPRLALPDAAEADGERAQLLSEMAPLSSGGGGGGMKDAAAPLPPPSLPSAASGGYAPLPPGGASGGGLRELLTGGGRWRLAAALFATHAATLLVFPGALAEDVRGSSFLGDWYPIALLTAFNACDFAGKLAPQRLGLLATPERAWRAALARAPLAPLFWAAARMGAGPATIGPLTAALGLTHGYVSAAALTAAPAVAPRGRAAALEAALILSLVCGLCAGAGLSWLALAL